MTTPHPEAAIEEGEIVRESAVHHVIRGSERVMRSVLSRLHTAACVPHLTPTKGGKVGVVGGSDMELPQGLQEGMTEWCDRMLALLSLQEEEEHKNKEW